MSASTISTYQLFQQYPDAEAARQYFEGRRWPTGVTCPFCDDDRITVRGGTRRGYYRCRACRKEFTVRTGTIFQRSHVPLHKWLYAMYLLVTARKGISSLQLAKEIGVTQKTAWFVLGRLREACTDTGAKLSGIVEVDEAFIGGREQTKHAAKRTHPGGGPGGKAPVLGLRQRQGRTVAMPVARTDQATLQAAIRQHVTAGAMIYTDEHRGYDGLTEYGRGRVRHSAGQYVRPGDIHINGAESVWAVLKRSIHGTWHHVSVKHLGRYVHEATFRLNEANVAIHTLDRLAAFADRAFRARLTYAELTA